MASTTFTNGVTLTDAGWFNDVNTITYKGLTTQILVGGGTDVLAVWTTATGTGAPVRAGSPTFTGTTTIPALTMTGNINLGANFISRAGTNAGLSLDASNNATLSGNLTVSGTGPHTLAGKITATTAAAADGLQITNGGATPKSLYIYTDATTTSFASGATATGYVIQFDQSVNAMRFFTGSTNEQVRITHTASATRYITLTGSNGGSSRADTSAGDFIFGAGGTTAFTAAGTATSGETWMTINVQGTGSVRISVGAVDSGGAGFRLLRVPN